MGGSTASGSVLAASELIPVVASPDFLLYFLFLPLLFLSFSSPAPTHEGGRYFYLELDCKDVAEKHRFFQFATARTRSLPHLVPTRLPVLLLRRNHLLQTFPPQTHLSFCVSSLRVCSRTASYSVCIVAQLVLHSAWCWSRRQCRCQIHAKRRFHPARPFCLSLHLRPRSPASLRNHGRRTAPRRLQPQRLRRRGRVPRLPRAALLQLPSPR